MLQTFSRNRPGAELARVPTAHRDAFEDCFDVIEAQLESDLPLRARGLAVFAAAAGKAPILSAMPFAVPFRSSLTVAKTPDLLPLMQLKELYGRVLIVSAELEGLHYLGGVGCLLRDQPQALAQPAPPHYGSLDLVA